jgi:hypothetical protein
MLGQSSGMCFTIQNEDKIHINIRPQTFCFRGTAQQHVDLKHSDFISGDTENPYCIQLQMKMKTHCAFVSCMPVKPIETAPEPLKGCYSP